jgi:glycogen operon protein
MADDLRPRPRRVVRDGAFWPLGATLAPGGVNFALYSQDATEVLLLLFDRPDGEPTDVISLPGHERRIWYGLVEGLEAGQLYGYKVKGPFDPRRGLRFNEHKLLVDPYAKAVTHKAVNRDNLLLAYDAGSPDADLTLDTRDDSAIVPKSIVIDDAFDWQGDTPLMCRLESLVIYEVHVKGFTAHPSSGVRHPGTYLGFAEKAPYLKELGVNAVELLPVHETFVEDFLHERGLTNYWGYNTLSFFAPEQSYATGSSPGCAVTEFKTMVRELHKAGIEVILDVVYNHSAEGNERGPTLSLRGVDNRTYYILTGGADDPGRWYMNYSGCGNSLDLRQAQTIRLVMDSLRYWVEVMHVDGFRFDLASVLGRDERGFAASSAFFDAISQDPVLARAKLIAEPWDLGTYQVGNFPVDWSEWNGRFRDTIRRFAKGDAGQRADLASRAAGSADLYGDDGRSAFNSINFVTCHDGFTLWDLVSYDGKHNEANREGNRDGTNDNLSWNCGTEGDTDDPEVLRLRYRLVRNHICHLLFSVGTPMLLGGDELLRSQRGNNNAYCQDNELSWHDWSRRERHGDFWQFVRRAIAFNQRYPVLQKRKYYTGADGDGDGTPGLTWFGADGASPQWNDAEARLLCWRLDGGEVKTGLRDYQLFFAFNADPWLAHVKLPAPKNGTRWHRVVDTSLAAGDDFLDPGSEVPLDPADGYLVNGRSTVVLIARAPR